MEVLCHRGLWHTPGEQNTLAAFRSAWTHGFGLETDVRDRDGHVVVSHDPPTAAAPALETVLEAYARWGRQTVLALNVKADGLAAQVAALLERYSVRHAFVFDMSVPDHLAWGRAGVATYTRWSDAEPVPVLLESSAGIWLDAFVDDAWWPAGAVRSALEAGHQVAVVSPELHGRAPHQTWRRVQDAGLHKVPGMRLCTDRAHDARRWFQ